MMTPDASASGFALSSSTSAWSRIDFRSPSRFCLALAETSSKIVSPPHSSGWSPWVTSSLRTRSGLASGRSILFTATTIGTCAALAWSIASTVCGMTPSSAATTSTATSVDLGAAGAHGGERLVARRVEERDLAAVGHVDLVGADVLGDAAGLGVDDRRLADGVEERGLAVVDVAHDGHDRRPGLERVRLVLERDLLGLLVGRVADLDLALELAADQLDRLVAQRLRDLHHLVRRHQERDDLGRRDAELLGEILDGDPGRDADGPGRNLGLASLLLARSAALAPLTGAAAGLGVDHDSAAASRRRPPLRAGVAAGLARSRRRRGGLLAVDAPCLFVVDDVGHGRIGGSALRPPRRARRRVLPSLPPRAWASLARPSSSPLRQSFHAAFRPLHAHLLRQVGGQRERAF